MKNNFLSTRSFKRGTLATVITALVIAIVIVVNVIIYALGVQYGFYIDMTSEDLFTLSDATKNILSGIDSEIRITFCHDPDYIETGSETLRNVYYTAREMAQEYSNIKIQFVNLYKNPTAVSKYMLSASTAIYQTSIIVESGPVDSPEFRVFRPAAFYIANEDGDVWAYNAEETFVSAFLSVTATDLPVACFTLGHGETISEDLVNVVAKAGYDVRTVDLSTEDIPADTRLIIMNAPLYDLPDALSAGEVNEATKLEKYLADFGSLMVFVSPDAAPRLTNLAQFLDQWGIVIGGGVVRDSSAHSLQASEYATIAGYSQNTDTVGYSLAKEIATVDAAAKTIVEYASPISFSQSFLAVTDDDGNYTGAYAKYANNSSRDVSAVLTSSFDAVIMQDGKQTDSSGSYILMALSREVRIKTEGSYSNEDFSSYVLVAATTNFSDSKYINSNSYANKDLLYTAFKLMGREKVPSGIDFKVLTSPTIDSITEAESTNWTVGLVSVLPIIALAAGLVVCVRRKYR